MLGLKWVSIVFLKMLAWCLPLILFMWPTITSHSLGVCACGYKDKVSLTFCSRNEGPVLMTVGNGLDNTQYRPCEPSPLGPNPLEECGSINGIKWMIQNYSTDSFILLPIFYIKKQIIHLSILIKNSLIN